MENDPLLTPAPPKDMEFSICFVVIFFWKLPLGSVIQIFIEPSK